MLFPSLRIDDPTPSTDFDWILFFKGKEALFNLRLLLVDFNISRLLGDGSFHSGFDAVEGRLKLNLSLVPHLIVSENPSLRHKLEGL